jgi:transcriptional regulator GlxA family with amidase domain
VRREPSQEDLRAQTFRFDTDQVQAECAGQGAAGFAAIFANLHFTHVLRTAYRRNWGDRPVDLRAPNLRRIAAVIEMVRKHPEDDWTIAQLAQRSGLSRSNFFASFLEYAGMPPRHFVSKVRMNRAAHLLRGGSLSLYEVAARCGYRLESSFARAFRNHYGVSPRQFVSVVNDHPHDGDEPARS